MTQASIRIGILETGRPPEDLADSFTDYPAMVRQWLGDIEAEFDSYPVLDGVFPDAPSSAELWVVTGSKFGAYEDRAWIPPLEQFIRDTQQAGKLMVGICFGHQIIAQAMGGRVEKSDKGWGLGVHSYAVDDSWPAELGPAPQGVSLQAFHQDQVIDKPDTAVKLAGSEFCENAALWYPGFAITVQGHPEFDETYSTALIKSRSGTVLTQSDAEKGLSSVHHPATHQSLAQIIRSHLLNA